ncbi:MAG: hypothetical protein LCH74_20240 [Proteobacteria bacterium]|nr:hypothetical protein [Pseudomonadota bacterium]
MAFDQSAPDVLELLQKAVNARRAMHYQRVFLDDDGTPSLSARKVLADLRKFCRVDRSTFEVDPRAHALLEGRREVALRILTMLGIRGEDIAPFVEVSDE